MIKTIDFIINVLVKLRSHLVDKQVMTGEEDSIEDLSNAYAELGCVAETSK